MKNFITPPYHVDFLAKKLFADCGEIIDGSIAYLSPSGGGPTEQHTHKHNHLFVVVSDRAKVKLQDKEIIINENESYLVCGSAPHSVWNDSDKTTIMLGISVKEKPRVNDCK